MFISKPSCLNDEPKRTTDFVLPCKALRCVYWLCIGLVACTSTSRVQGEAAYAPDALVTWLHEEDPEIIIPGPVTVWPAAYQRIWSVGLQGPDPDLRREVADSIRLAVKLGFEPNSALRQSLADVVANPNEESLVLTAAASALAEIDAREFADLLYDRLDSGSVGMRLGVEQALARWHYAPMQQVWLERISNNQSSRALRSAAIEHTGTMGNPKAVDALSAIVLARKESPLLRIRSSRALALCAQDSQTIVAWSEKLLEMEPPKMVNSVVGASLLSQQDSTEAIELLTRYVTGEFGTAAGIAAERLWQVAPQELVDRAETLLQHSDSTVRLATVRSLESAPTETAVTQLASMMNDPINQIRAEARTVLVAHGENDSLRAAAIAECEKQLNSEDWRGLEQAVLALTELRHLPAQNRFFELVDHPKPAVFITAAWGIKMLAIDPWMPRVDKKIRDMLATGTRTLNPDVAQALSHLLECVGRLGYRPSKDILVSLIPKTVPQAALTRTAAIWSLGFVATPEDDPEIVSALRARVSDTAAMPAEAPEVRAYAAVSLGRMQAVDAVEMLRDWMNQEGPSVYLGRHCAWAVRELDGTPLPPLVPTQQAFAGWPLQPADY